MSALQKPDVPVHKVQFSLGYTVNAGNFESLRIDVGLEIEGKPGETPEQTYQRAADWVAKKLEDQVRQAKEDLTEGN